MAKMMDVGAFRAAAKHGARPEGAVFRLATNDPVAVAEDSRTLRFIFSDGSVDRAGDRIDAGGWVLTDFLKNPVALWAHCSDEPPIGRAKNVGQVGDMLMGDIEFMPAETSAFADSIFRMIQGGYIKAVSVGFMPIEYTFVEDKDRPWGIDFKRQELLEISVCPVPCNSSALLAAKAHGIDTGPLSEWAAKVLDSGASVWVRRAMLEKLFAEAKTPEDERKTYLAARDMGEGTTGDGGALVAPGVCGQGAGAECAMKDPQQCAVHCDLPAGTTRPSGHCGMGASVECGMKDPQQCAAHCTGTKSFRGGTVGKAGRRISQANTDKLNKAIEHIQSVIDSNEPEPDPTAEVDPGSEGSAELIVTQPQSGDTGYDEPHEFPARAAAARERARAILAKVNSGT